MTEQIINVAIVGCGTVGAAVASLLSREQALLTSRTQARINLKYIVDVDFSKARAAGLDERLFSNSIDQVLADKSITVVVELVGGLTFAKEVIEKAVEAKKHVVTANKALLAHHIGPLMALARKNGVSIGFEASCGGGIPIILALTNGLLANRIGALYGILNGTCNYILTAMTQQGKSYKTALKEAQVAGYAEADPYLDVSGTDTAHKLAILSALAFGQKIDFKAISISGIDTLHERDIAYGQELGYVIKLLAIAHRNSQGVNLAVRPAFISKAHPLAWVSGTFNAVSVYGHANGHTMYYGRGAGGMPTASAVVADLLSIACGTAQATFNQFIGPDRAAEAVQLPAGESYGRYYVRILASDKPGVLAEISKRLGDNQISISSVLQKEPPDEAESAQGVPVVITTYKSKEQNLKQALKEIDGLTVVKGQSICIEIVDEPDEFPKDC